MESSVLIFKLLHFLERINDEHPRLMHACSSVKLSHHNHLNYKSDLKNVVLQVYGVVCMLVRQP